MKNSFLIERFRFLVKTRDKYNQSLTTIYNMLYSIMFRVNDNYNQGIFTQNKLTNYFGLCPSLCPSNLCPLFVYVRYMSDNF